MTKCFSLLTITAAFVLSTACGSSEKNAENPQPVSDQTGDESAESSPDLQASCEAMFAKARTCSDEYLTALVDLRVRLDIPAGIAEDDRTEGRDALLATAHEEWAEDSQPANAAATCGNIVSKMTPEQGEAVAASTQACVSQDTCSDFVACIMPLHEEMFKDPSHMPSQP